MNQLTRSLLAAGLIGLSSAAVAQVVTPPGIQVPVVPAIGANDLFDDVVGGQPQANSQYVGVGNLAGYIANAGFGPNFLIGGDADTNLWQRGTTGASVTTTITYDADRWAIWSGTSTAITESRDSTAAALPTGSKYDFKLQRTAAQSGVVQICKTQEIETAHAQYLAGHTVEVDYNVYTGANFSATALSTYISYGTGTDEGVSKYAFAFNGGGGGSSTWAGQANATTGLVSGLAVSTAYRVAAVASIPTTATEIGVTLCYTPTGTAGTTDALYFTNIELRKADGLANFVSSTAGYIVAANNTISAVVGNATQFAQIPAFDKRGPGIETLLQQRYYYQVNEPAASKAVGNGSYLTSTICDVQIPLPVTMRAIPTAVIVGGSATTWAIMIASTTPVVLASTWLIQDAVVGNTVNTLALQGTTAGKTAGQGCTLVGAGGGASFAANAEL